MTRTDLDDLIARHHEELRRSFTNDLYDAVWVAGVDPSFLWTDELHKFVYERAWTPFQSLGLTKQVGFVRKFTDSAVFERHATVAFRALLTDEQVHTAYRNIRAAIHSRLDAIEELASAGDETAAGKSLQELFTLDPSSGTTFEHAKFAWTKGPSSVHQRHRYHELLHRHFGMIVEYHYDKYVSLESAYMSVCSVVQEFEARGLPREEALKALREK
jgi:hypothetical protein